jgi:hypothetical protein
MGRGGAFSFYQHSVVFGPAPMQSSGAGSFDGGRDGNPKKAATQEESRHQHSADDGLGISLARTT